MKSVCVFCASSSKVLPLYFSQAKDLGGRLARQGYEVLFGGGGIGLMGALAEGVLEHKGAIKGVIPRFMLEAGWGNAQVQDMKIVENMHDRKRFLLQHSEAVITLPGGIGTLEELTEAITLKQLGLFRGPVLIVNTNGFYTPLLSFLEKMIREHFMRREHKDMWTAVANIEEVIPILQDPDPWIPNARDIARI